jgi:hypothetical protein
MNFFNPTITQVFEKSSDYTISEGDNKNVISFFSAVPVLCSIPKGLAVGFTCTIVQEGEGKITFDTPGNGNEINPGDTRPKETTGAWSRAKIICLAEGKYSIEYSGAPAANNNSGSNEIILISQFGNKFRLTVDEEVGPTNYPLGTGSLTIEKI